MNTHDDARHTPDVEADLIEAFQAGMRLVASRMQIKPSQFLDTTTEQCPQCEGSGCGHCRQRGEVLTEDGVVFLHWLIKWGPGR